MQAVSTGRLTSSRVVRNEPVSAEALIDSLRHQRRIVSSSVAAATETTLWAPTSDDLHHIFALEPTSLALEGCHFDETTVKALAEWLSVKDGTIVLSAFSLRGSRFVASSHSSSIHVNTAIADHSNNSSGEGDGLSTAGVPPSPWSSIWVALLEITTLERLCLSDMQLSDSDCDDFSQSLIPWNRSIVEWDFSHNPKLSASSCFNIAKAFVSAASAVQCVAFGHCGIEDPEALVHVLQTLRTLSYLTLVDFTGNPCMRLLLEHVTAMDALRDLEDVLHRNGKLLYPYAAAIHHATLFDPLVDAAASPPPLPKPTNASCSNNVEESAAPSTSSPIAAKTPSFSTASPPQVASPLRKRSSFLYPVPQSSPQQQQQQQGSSSSLERRSSIRRRQASSTGDLSPVSANESAAAKPTLQRRQSLLGAESNSSTAKHQSTTSAVNAAQPLTSVSSAGRARGSSNNLQSLPSSGELATPKRVAPMDPLEAPRVTSVASVAVPAPSADPQASLQLSPVASGHLNQQVTPFEAVDMSTASAGFIPALVTAAPHASLMTNPSAHVSTRSHSAGRSKTPTRQPSASGSSSVQRCRTPPASHREVNDGYEEWRRVKEQYNQYIRPTTTPNRSTSQSTSIRQVALQQPKYVLGKLVSKDAGRVSSFFRESINAFKSVREPNPAERRKVLQQMGLVQPHDITDAYGSPGRLYASTAQSTATYVGQKIIVPDPRCDPRHPQAICVIDGGDVTYLDHDPREIAYAARKAASSGKPSAIFRSNTPRECRWGTGPRDEVGRVPQAPPPGSYDVPSHFDELKRRAQNRSRVVTSTGKQLFGTTGSNRSFVELQMKPSATQIPGPGAYEIP